MNDEKLRIALIKVMEAGLLNILVNRIFNYNLEKDEYVYIQYKIVNKNIVLNIFDNSDKNRFEAFIFGTDDIRDSQDVSYININSCYEKYFKNNKDPLILLASLLKSTNNDEKKEIIDTF